MLCGNETDKIKIFLEMLTNRIIPIFHMEKLNIWTIY